MVIIEVVVLLEVLDEFLKNRVMNLFESVVVGMYNMEEGNMFCYLNCFFLFLGWGSVFIS